MAFPSRTSYRPTLNATRARSGRMGVHVFWVLLFGTLLAALALFAAWTWNTGEVASVEPRLERQAADQPVFAAPEPAPVIAPPQASQPAPGT